MLPTLGGQTGLNVGMALHETGALKRHGCVLIGASAEAIRKAEDRELFKRCMEEIGLESARSGLAHNLDEARRIRDEIGLPCVLRPSFTLGGSGGGIAYNREEFDRMVATALELSPVHSVLIEESVIGWKEYEMEVMRDGADNAVIVCSIENFDPMGVHTGDSITVAPAQTLTDKEYQRMRDASLAILRKIGVETGGSNVQFAIHPDTGRMIVIEMNPRVSRSQRPGEQGDRLSDRQDRRQAGRRLPARRDPQRHHPRDAGLLRADDRLRGDQGPPLGIREVPRGRPGPDHADEVGRRGHGDRPDLQGVAPEGPARAGGRPFRPGLRQEGPLGHGASSRPIDEIKTKLAIPNAERVWSIRYALLAGLTVEQIHTLTGIDPWFLANIEELVQLEGRLRRVHSLDEAERCPGPRGQAERLFRPAARQLCGTRPRPRSAATASAGASAPCSSWWTPAPPSSRRSRPITIRPTKREDEARIGERPRVVILGGGPNRIGQGIEFDYCCCQAAFALRADGYEVVMVNSNPETVSTDYDTSDRLFFEPLTVEDVLNVCERVEPMGVIVQFGGQTPLNLARALEAAGVPIIGTSPEIDRPGRGPRAVPPGDRAAGAQAASQRLGDPLRGGAADRRADRLPGRGPPQLRAGRPGHGDRLRRAQPRSLHDRSGRGQPRAPDLDR